MACYARPGERLTFYEIDPTVARSPATRGSSPTCATARGATTCSLGDGRKSSSARARGEYGLITIDAFNSDSVPVHLLTREALQLYLRRLRPDGMLLFNISNRFVDFEPVLGNLAPTCSLNCAIEQPAGQRRAVRAPLGLVDLGRDVRDPAIFRRLGWRACAVTPAPRCGRTTSRTCSARCGGARGNPWLTH